MQLKGLLSRGFVVALFILVPWMTFANEPRSEESENQLFRPVSFNSAHLEHYKGGIFGADGGMISFRMGWNVSFAGFEAGAEISFPGLFFIYNIIQPSVWIGYDTGPVSAGLKVSAYAISSFLAPSLAHGFASANAFSRLSLYDDTFGSYAMLPIDIGFHVTLWHNESFEAGMMNFFKLPMLNNMPVTIEILYHEVLE